MVVTNENNADIKHLHSTEVLDKENLVFIFNHCTLILLSRTLLYTLEKELATCSTILTWEIPWTEEPGELQSMGSKKELDTT